MNIINIKETLKLLSVLPLKKKKWDDVLYVAIISTGRTGTRFLSSLINRHTSDCYSLHEPFGIRTKNLAIKYHKGEINKQIASKQITRQRVAILRNLYILGKNTFVESDGNLTYLLPVIRSNFSKYKIIHVIRDGKDVVRSFCSRTVNLNGHIVQKYALKQYWPFVPMDVGVELDTNRWRELSLIGKGAWSWNYLNKYILEEEAQDENILSVRFEDIFNAGDDFSCLKSIFSFIGTKCLANDKELKAAMKVKINRTKKFLVPPFEDWSEDDQKLFFEFTTDINHIFGY